MKPIQVVNSMFRNDPFQGVQTQWSRYRVNQFQDVTLKPIQVVSSMFRNDHFQGVQTQCSRCRVFNTVTD